MPVILLDGVDFLAIVKLESGQSKNSEKPEERQNAILGRKKTIARSRSVAHNKKSQSRERTCGATTNNRLRGGF